METDAEGTSPSEENANRPNSSASLEDWAKNSFQLLMIANGGACLAFVALVGSFPLDQAGASDIAINAAWLFTLGFLIAFTSAALLPGLRIFEKPGQFSATHWTAGAAIIGSLVLFHAGATVTYGQLSCWTQNEWYRESLRRIDHWQTQLPLLDAVKQAQVQRAIENELERIAKMPGCR